tara:strand:- start:358 stop:516 length:159 start_codon:yes stop_codon:yes gene_type:complete
LNIKAERNIKSESKIRTEVKQAQSHQSKAMSHKKFRQQSLSKKDPNKKRALN